MIRIDEIKTAVEIFRKYNISVPDEALATISENTYSSSEPLEYIRLINGGYGIEKIFVIPEQAKKLLALVPMSDYYSLPSRQIEVLELHFFKGMSYNDISEKVNICVTSVKDSIKYGLDNLRFLSKYPELTTEDIRTTPLDQIPIQRLRLPKKMENRVIRNLKSVLGWKKDIFTLEDLISMNENFYRDSRDIGFKTINILKTKLTSLNLHLKDE